MKKNLLLTLLTIALIVGALAAVVLVTSAQANEPELSIAYCNLSFRDSVCIKYAVKANVPDVKILIWTSPEADYTVGTEDGEITGYYTENIGGTPHMVFDYTDLVAKQMADVVYARAYASVDGVDYYSPVNKYSILQYAYNKLGKTATATSDTELKEMLSNMLIYGASAQKYFDYKEDRLATANWYQVKVSGGILDDGCNHGLYLPGDTVTLTAPATNAEGNAFSHWADSKGNEIATTAVFELTVGNANERYTPVYQTELAPGLYQTGTSTLISSWDELVQNGDIAVSGTTITDANTSLAGDLVVKKGITSIREDAFVHCRHLTSITIPASVTSIDGYAFYDCESLKSITFGANSQLTSIGQYAFTYCRSLKSITIPEGVTSIGKHAFDKCANLTSVTFGANSQLTNIGSSAFYDCTSLTSITIPESVTSIGNYAFYNCDSLMSVTFGANSQLTSIGSSAFEYCESLTSITIPASVTSIGGILFAHCDSLASVTVAADNTVYHSAGNCIIETETGKLIAGCNNSSIPTDGSVKSILGHAFYGCTSLTSIAIPASVTSVGDDAFSWCTSLTSITFAANSQLTSIGEQAFYECTSLTSITIPASVTSIGDYAFWVCTSLASVAFEKTGGWTAGGTKLSTTDLADPAIAAEYLKNTYRSRIWTHTEAITATPAKAPTCTEAGNIAYWTDWDVNYYSDADCTVAITLADTVIPAMGHSYEDGVCTECGMAQNLGLYVTGTTTLIASWDELVQNGDITLSDDGIAITDVNTSLAGDLVLRNGITSIGSYAFQGCTSLSSITLPTSVTSIGESAFINCRSLSSVTFGDNSQLTSIGSYAFQGCTSLSSITLPTSVTSIGGAAFSGCTSLTSITIPADVTSIGSSAFYNCTSLSSITVAADNLVYHSAGNCLIETANGNLIAGCKNSIIPIDGSVTSIGSSAFYNCTSLSSITIPDSVTSIGSNAFTGCTSLASVTFGANSRLTSIGIYAFWNCTSLKSITIPASVTSIGYYAFWNCTSLTSVTFKDTTTWYRTQSFSNWLQKTRGTSTSVTDAVTNATYFKSTYFDYYWYKK